MQEKQSKKQSQGEQTRHPLAGHLAVPVWSSLLKMLSVTELSNSQGSSRFMRRPYTVCMAQAQELSRKDWQGGDACFAFVGPSLRTCKGKARIGRGVTEIVQRVLSASDFLEAWPQRHRGCSWGDCSDSCSSPGHSRLRAQSKKRLSHELTRDRGPRNSLAATD